MTLSVCLSACLHDSQCLSVCLSVRLSVCLSAWLSVSVCLSVRLSVCLSACLLVCVSVCLSVSVCVCVSVQSRWLSTWFDVRLLVTILSTFSDVLSLMLRYTAVLCSLSWYITLLTCIAEWIKRNLQSYLVFHKTATSKNVSIASMLTLDESSYVVDAEYGVGDKNKVTHVTWFSFGTLQLLHCQ